MTPLQQAISRSIARQSSRTFTPTGWSGVIKGELASLKNSRQMVPRRSRTGKTYMAPIKSEKAAGWLGSALQQVIGKVGLAPITCDVILTATIWYASRRPDLSDELLCDFLQAARIIENDRQIIEKHIFKRLDKADPRVEIEVRSA